MANQRQIAYDGVLDAEYEENKLADDEAKIEQEILSEFSADGEQAEWRVVVKKVSEKTKKQDTCFIMSPDELPGLFERLKNEFGPGQYRAYVQRNGQTKRNLGYSIAKPMEGPLFPQQQSPIAEISRLIERQNEQLANIFSRGTPAAAPTADPFQQMAAIDRKSVV